jgi:moderate conductance mechanosensitive channel
MIAGKLVLSELGISIAPILGAASVDVGVVYREDLAEALAVILRGRFKVAPLQQWDVRREYLRRLKRAFDEQRIESPCPHLTVCAGISMGVAAPPFPVRQAGGTK